MDVFRSSTRSWELIAAAPAREVFAAMEQLIGKLPYRFEVVDPQEARIVEVERRGFFGQWTTPRRRLGRVCCSAVDGDRGTNVHVEAHGGRPELSRALDLVRLLRQGFDDKRTVYRDRHIPPGPVTLVASWGAMEYHLYTEPSFGAPRDGAIIPATPLWAVPGGRGPFVKVRLPAGQEGYVERDEIVAAPVRATREAQLEAARFV